ncbi:hypothetical protein HK097_003096 [Rhizophlyctis rosea]|uniref:Uncharacterized protein n=1 Tax=Rhizophlyctis rosea TaxID=64517 RepID=A0AAD5S4N0_9FUNG|nr:hypothetical protein HK097_003096 [Rhizophlyctis rosea]
MIKLLESANTELQKRYEREVKEAQDAHANTEKILRTKTEAAITERTAWKERAFTYLSKLEPAEIGQSVWQSISSENVSKRIEEGEEYERQLQDLQQALNDLQTRHESVLAVHATLQTQADHDQSELADLKLRYRAMEDNLTEMKDKLRYKDDCIKRLETKIKRNDENIAMIEMKVQRVERKAGRLARGAAFDVEKAKNGIIKNIVCYLSSRTASSLNASQQPSPPSNPQPPQQTSATETPPPPSPPPSSPPQSSTSTTIDQIATSTSIGENSTSIPTDESSTSITITESASTTIADRTHIHSPTPQPPAASPPSTSINNSTSIPPNQEPHTSPQPPSAPSSSSTPAHSSLRIVRNKWRLPAAQVGGVIGHGVVIRSLEDKYHVDLHFNSVAKGRWRYLSITGRDGDAAAVAAEIGANYAPQMSYYQKLDPPPAWQYRQK